MVLQARLLLLIGLIAVVAISVYCNASWLLSQAYLRFADDRAQSFQTLPVALQASRIAQKMQPSSAHALQASAGYELFLGQPDQALNHYAAALKLAPADAYLWRDYAMALVYAGKFDGRLDHAVDMAQTWGLQSSPIHLSLALTGLKVFQQSGRPLRALWMKSIKRAYWERPDAVLLTAYNAEQELLLCDGSVILKPETNVWCAAARWRHGLCSTAGTGVDGCFRRQAAQP